MEIPKEVIEKLGKILTLANNEGATEGEVLAAMGKAREILQKFDLSLEDFSSISRDKNKDDEVVEESIFETKAKSTWVAEMLSGIALLTNTKFFYYQRMKYPEKKVQYVFIGARTDVGVAAALASYFYYAAKGFADIYVQTISSSSMSEKKRYRTSFYLGFAHRIYEKAQSIIEEEKRKAAEASQKDVTERSVTVAWNQVVIKKQNAILKYEEDRLKNLKIRKAKVSLGIHDEGGYQAGKQTADKIMNSKPTGFIKDK